MRRRLVPLVCLFAVGCAEASSPRSDSSRRAGAAKEAARVAVVDDVGAMGGEGQGAAQGAAGAPADAAEQRIIYSAELSVVVKDLAVAAERIQALAADYKGYVADGGVDRTRGSYPTGRWVVRVPSDRLEEALAELSEMGVPERRSQTAQDVTEEYVDLEARIANKRRLEERILELLDQREGKIGEVIEVERELSRVREEIERMEGRLRFLQNRTAYATVTVNAREEKDYVPPQAPTFRSQIGTTWDRSLESLRLFGKGTVIVAVALTPWLPLLLVVLLVVIWLLRRLRRAALRALGRA